MSVADETDYMGRDAAAKWLAKAEQRLTSRRHGPKGSKAVTKRRRKKISRRSHADTKTDQADGHIGDHLAGPITNNSTSTGS